MSIATRVAACAALTIGSLAGMAVAPAVASATTSTAGSTGYDVSYPQCPSSFPNPSGAFDVLGVNDGIVYQANPCLGSEYNWAAAGGGAVSFYVNTANPGPSSSHWPAGQTTPNGVTCPAQHHYQLGTTAYNNCSYVYGWNAAQNSYSDAAGVNPTAAASAQWWLDIESANSWTRSYAANIADIQGALAFFALNTTAGNPGTYSGSGYVGIYTNSSSWSKITGSTTSLTAYPSWLPDQYGSMTYQNACTGYPSVTGGHIRYTQYSNSSWDGDYDCG